MSTHSQKFQPKWRRYLACTLASVLTAGLILLLPQNQRALPAVSRPVHAAERLLRPAAMLLPGAGDFCHTDGNRILDTHNRPIRIAGVNWSGFETKEAVLGGLEARDYRAILQTIQQNGYNTVRIPFSNEMVEAPSVPEHVRFQNAGGPINTDLRDLNSLEILDKVVNYAGRIGLKVILDDHRSEAGSSAEESGLWYTQQFPESTWIEDWTSLARRYQKNSAVIGMDLRNEPHNAEKGGACWDCGGPNDWHRAAARAGNAILAINPRLLIFVEGVDTYGGDTYWWGGNLEGVRRSPVRLSVPNRLVYSAHEYGPTEYAQPWFNAATSTAALASIWRRHWAYISEAGIAPVWIGEFGTTNDDVDVRSSIAGSEGQWFTSLVDFLAGHPALNWTYWGVNGEDRYGLLDLSYSKKPANLLKAEALAGLSQGRPSQTAARAPAETETASETSSPPIVNSTRPAVLSVPSYAESGPSISYEPAAQEISIDRGDAGRPGSKRPGASFGARRLPLIDSSSETSVQSAISADVQKAVSTANKSLRTRGDWESR